MAHKALCKIMLYKALKIPLICPRKSLSSYIKYRNGYWSGNRTPISVAIGPAIGHVSDRKRQSDSYVYFVCVASVN